jgi:hypothetical protein
MATSRKKKVVETASKMSRTDIKQKIRALKKERATANERAARAKVDEFNVQLKIYRRRLRRAARHKK